MSEVLNKLLDLGIKYGPEVSQYFSGQKRIKQAIEDQRKEKMPELARKTATASEQNLLNMANRALLSPAREDLRRNMQSALRQTDPDDLSRLLRASAGAEDKIAQSEIAQRMAASTAAAPIERSIEDYNNSLLDREKLYMLMKDRNINELEDQSQRMKGKGFSTLFDILGDSRGMFAKPLDENPPDRMEQVDSLPDAQIENPALEKTLLGSPNSLDMSALQKAREYGDNLTAGNELMDLLYVDVSAPEDMKPLPRKDGPLGSGVRRRPDLVDILARGRGPLSSVDLSRSQTGPRVPKEKQSLVDLGGPGSFDFSDPNMRALFNLLRQ